MTWSRVCR